MKKNIRRLIGISVVVLTILLASEIVLRIFKYPSSYTSIYEFDHEIGYRLTPGKHVIFIGDHKHSFFVDNDGVLDRNISGRAEVVLLGDGVVAGMELAPEKRLARQLGSITGYSVVNLSVPGYGTVQQWLTLRRWILKNGKPEHAFIVYNLANDYFDNVQAWESTRIPGIQKNSNGIQEVFPVIPTAIGRLIRYVKWNSRLYSLFSQLKESNPNKDSLPRQQRWFYQNVPPEESIRGDIATKLAVAQIDKLSKEYGFSLTWLPWHDFSLEYSEGVSGYIAIEKIKRLMPKGEKWVYISPGLGSNPYDIARWEREWIYPQTRHASASAIRYIAFRLCKLLPHSSCTQDDEVSVNDD